VDLELQGALALGLALRAAGGYGFVAMSRTTRARAKALRPRLEVARLRAHGGLSQRVVVDGMSILQWCARVGATYAAIIAEVATTAETGHRELVVVTPPDAPIALASPHRIVLSTTSAAALFRGNALQNLSFSAPPSVLVADVAADRDLLDAIAAGAHNILDVATGRLWHGDVQEEYDLASAAERGRAAASLNPAETDALASAVVTPLVSPTGGRLHVAAEIHRENGAVVLDGVAIDDGVRRYARGHKDSLALLRSALANGVVPVMTSSMDVMDALYDVGFPLPKGVEDRRSHVACSIPTKASCRLALGESGRKSCQRVEMRSQFGSRSMPCSTSFRGSTKSCARLLQTKDSTKSTRTTCAGRSPYSRPLNARAFMSIPTDLPPTLPPSLAR
jgi:hypothetical protein